NVELTKATVCYGEARVQEEAEATKKKQLALPQAAQADRAAFYANSARGASYDLVECVKNNRVKLEDLKKEQLPPEMQKMTLAEQKEYLKKVEQRRSDLNQQAVTLDKKRREYVAQKQAEDTKNRARDSFDIQVLTILQRQ